MASRSPAGKGGAADRRVSQMNSSASAAAICNGKTPSPGRRVIEMLSATAGYFSPVYNAPKGMCFFFSCSELALTGTFLFLIGRQLNQMPLLG